MSDLLPEEELTKQYYDSSANTWTSSHNTTGFWQEEMSVFNTLLPVGNILEVGSGGGRDAEDLIELGYEYVGTDISTGLLSVARKRLPGVEFVEQSIYELSLPQAPFDGFWASAVLLHIPRSRIDESLTSIRRVIKDKAIGFIAIKDGVGEEMEIADKNPELKRLFTYWSKEDFTEKLQANNFDVVDYMYRPISERTKWHGFFVEAQKN
jgi:ubiquinone/menaquinone biosynthesis C-methylase UbiE